jgi:four helix bundle protein
MNYKTADQNIILEKSFNFALISIKLANLLRDKREYVFANQLLKAGTSIGANVEEAVASVSRKEFHVKMSISSKEARETRYWLRLLKASGTLHPAEVSEALEKINEIIRILTAIVKTTRQSM